MKRFNKPLKRSEKILLVLFAITLIAVVLRWEKVKEGFLRGWEQYDIVEWFSKE